MLILSYSIYEKNKQTIIVITNIIIDQWFCFYDKTIIFIRKLSQRPVAMPCDNEMRIMAEAPILYRCEAKYAEFTRQKFNGYIILRSTAITGTGGIKLTKSPKG